MKLVSVVLSMTYLGTLYLVHAEEKRNIRRLQKKIDVEIVDSEPVIVGTSLQELEKEEKLVSEENVHDHHDEIDPSTIIVEEDNEISVDSQPTNQRRRKTGTVTSFDVIGKGASTPVVDTTNTVVVVGEYPKRQYYGGSSYSKGGKGKGGGRYGYYHHGSSYSKGKGRHRYYGGARGRVVDTATIVKEQVVVGKGAR